MDRPFLFSFEHFRSRRRLAQAPSLPVVYCHREARALDNLITGGGEGGLEPSGAHVHGQPE